MHNAIIVDDETLFLNYMVEKVDWQKYGIQIIQAFPSARMALDFLQEHDEIDILMTDIIMPETTGIQLIQQLSEDIIKRLYILVLSGYSEFELVKSAFQQGASDYLLKIDLNTEKFEATMHRMTDILNKHNSQKSPIESGTIEGIEEYIKNNLKNPLSLNELSQHFGFVPGYLSALFSKRAGVTLSYYIAKARIEEAMVLLDTTDSPITDIAFEVGFNHLEHFSRTFHRFAQCSPRDYRKKQQSAE